MAKTHHGSAPPSAPTSKRRKLVKIGDKRPVSSIAENSQLEIAPTAARKPRSHPRKLVIIPQKATRRSGRIRNLTVFNPKEPRHVNISDSSSDSEPEKEPEPVINNSEPEVEAPAVVPERPSKLPLRSRAKVLKHTEDILEPNSQKSDDSPCPQQPTPKEQLKKKAVQKPVYPIPNLTMKFQRPKDQQRFGKIKGKKLCPMKSLHVPTMESLGILDSVRHAFDCIGWSSLLALNCPAYYELVYEFYATFEYDKIDAAADIFAPDVVRFRLLGKIYSMSLTDFNIALGLVSTDDKESDEYRSAYCDYIPGFNVNTAFRTLTGRDGLIFPSMSRSTYIVDGHLRYIHRFLSSSISVRVDDTGSISKAELFFLWCMQTRKRVNLGYWLGVKFQSVLATKRTRPLILGSFITLIAANLNVLRPSKLTIGLHLDDLDIDSLSKMNLVEKSGKGSVRLLSADELRAKEEAVPTTSDGQIRSLTSEVQKLKRKVNKMMQAQKALCAHFNIQWDVSSDSEGEDAA